MCRGHDPLFQASWHSLAYQIIYYQCAAHMPPFSIIRKKLRFQHCLRQNFSSEDAKFQNFRSQDPLFLKNLLPGLYFLKPVRHIPTKKKV